MTAIVASTVLLNLAIVVTFVFTSRSMRRDVALMARQLVTDAHQARGRCGKPTPGVIPGVVPVYCELPHGHPGWHRHGSGSSGVATEWGRRE